MRSGILFYAYLPNLLIVSILYILPLYALCRTIFEPYFGSHKIRNSLILKNMQKKFFRVAPPPDFIGSNTPAPLCKYLIIILVKNHKTNKVTVVNTNNKHFDSTGAVEYIHTKYKPLSFTKDYTLLEVELITGKTHQIRSHLASTGHPIIGDFKYGDKTTNQSFKERFGLQYQLLHAYRIVFPKIDGTLKVLSEKAFIAPCTELFEEIRKGVNL